MPINSEHLASLTDADVVDQNGAKVGGVGQIYLDDASGQPAWVSVKSGLFGLRESFVPLASAEVANGNIQVPYSKDFIKDAPRVDGADSHLDDAQQATLFSYYGVDRSAASESVDDAPDRTAAFGSEETAEGLYDGRTESEPVADAEEPDGAVTTEYTTPGGHDEPSGGVVADGGNDLGSGEVTGAEVTGADVTRDAAAIGAGAAAGTTAAGLERENDSDPVSGLAAEDVAAAGGNAEWAETRQAHYQQENPAAQADWAAEEAPDEPVSTDWSVPSTNPATEEPTQVARGGYSPDRPAAHSSAYEGHGGSAAGAGAAGAAGAGAAASAAGLGAMDPTTDKDAVYAADADTDLASAAAAGGSDSGDVDAGQFGTVHAATGDPAYDDAVTGASDQTGTGYPAGVAASDTETTAYEIPGAEKGSPVTDVEPGAALAEDIESPADGATLPAGTDGSGEPDAGAEPEAFGAEGYRPDRDGTEMTDEEREELNRARGAL